MNRPPLLLDWCSYAAAKHAVVNWHYSQGMPAGKLVRIGVWEGDRFTGAILFGQGANRHIGTELGLDMLTCAELVRVALRDHEWPVTRMVSIAMRMLKRQSPGLRAVVSYADKDQGHHGGIYAGGGWVYVGCVYVGVRKAFRVHGQVMHCRSCGSRGWRQSLDWLRANVDPSANVVRGLGKHKFYYPLDDAMRRQLAPLARPYPKRAGSIGGDAPAIQAGEGGSNPTPALDVAVGEP